MIFTNLAPLSQVGHRVAMSVFFFVCLSVCAIGCSLFLGLSLALTSHDQFQAPHWSLPPSLSWKLVNLETWKLTNLVTQKLKNKETPHPPPKKNIFFWDKLNKFSFSSF